MDAYLRELIFEVPGGAEKVDDRPFLPDITRPFDGPPVFNLDLLFEVLKVQLAQRIHAVRQASLHNS